MAGSQRIIFGTGNPNKLGEVQQMLSRTGKFEIIGLPHLGHTEELEETGTTLTANARQKVDFIYEKYGEPVFAEDAGLEVDALNGAPGVYSARYAGEDKDPVANMTRVLKELEGASNRQARFKSVIAFRDGTSYIIAEGSVEGFITHQPSGSGGFGYDPIFQPAGFVDTFSALPGRIKQAISHRAKAWHKLKQELELFYS